jgi:predicted O-methyltransferase YrrM
MSNTHTGLSEPLAAYLREISVEEPDVLRRLREQTALLPHGRMQITPEQGHFMRLLVRLLGARKALETGVFTGYSSTCVALELPAYGSLIACDISAEWTEVAKRYWREAGVEDRIRLHPGPAADTLRSIVSGRRIRDLRLRVCRRRQGVVRDVLRIRAGAPAGGV